MTIDPTLLSPVSALCGALVGGVTSLLGAIYSQRSQGRVQRVASETAKREALYADFVMSASNLLLNAYTRDEIALSGDEQRLIGLINRMRLFAPADVVQGAEAVLKAIVEILLQPSVELGQLARAALSNGLDPDPLLAFSSICRKDLDNLHRATVGEPRIPAAFDPSERPLDLRPSRAHSCCLTEGCSARGKWLPIAVSPLRRD